MALTVGPHLSVTKGRAPALSAAAALERGARLAGLLQRGPGTGPRGRRRKGERKQAARGGGGGGENRAGPGGGGGGEKTLSFFFFTPFIKKI